MAKESIQAAVAELQALLECYRYLSTIQNQSVASCGQRAIYSTMYEILHHDDIYGILLQSIQFPFEDYIHHVESDTDEFISVLRAYLEN